MPPAWWFAPHLTTHVGRRSLWSGLRWRGIDGVVDTHWSYVYDARGLDERDEGDYGVDGTIDEVWEYEWDDAENLIGLRQLIAGELTFTMTSTFDADGNALTEAYDVDGDGDLFGTDTYTYTYERGRLTVEESDYESNGVPEHRITYSYDRQDRIAQVSYDDLVDDSFDAIDTYVYDATGDLRIETDDLITPEPIDRPCGSSGR